MAGRYPFQFAPWDAAMPRATEIEFLIAEMSAVWRFAVHVCEVRFAEDLVQETYLRAFRAPSRPPDAYSARLFLFKILHDLVVQRAAEHQQLASAADQAMTLPEPAPPGSEGQNELDHQLRMAVCELPLPQRVVFLFAIVERLRDLEIAEIVGIEPHRVRERLNDAHSAITTKLSFETPPPPESEPT